jgi:hypothetical protein
MAFSPTNLQVPQPPFLNNIHELQATVTHPQVLSDNDDFIVLPDQLRQAPPIDFIPPYTESQPFRLIFSHSSAFQPAIYFIRFIALLGARLYLTYASHLAYSIEGAGECL